MRAGLVYLSIAFGLLAVSYGRDRRKTKEALRATGKILYTILPVLIFVFVLMGLIQAYVSREMIAAVLGKQTGVFGILYAELIGSVALFLPPAVFPFGGYLYGQGAAYGPIAGFVFTAILIGVTTLPLELKFMGKRFTIARNVLTFVIVFFLAFLMEVILTR
jgi:uncharacterized membrane protein YraQ (UPF0718 family)